MLTIKIGSSSSTLSKLQAITVGESLKNKFQDIKIQYFLEHDPLEIGSKFLDLFVYNTSEFEIGEVFNSSIFSVLPRTEQREIILFKKNISHSNENQIKIICQKTIHTENTLNFLKNYLPISIQKKQFILHPSEEETLLLLKKFLTPEIDGIVLPKVHLDRLFSTKLYPDQTEEFKSSRDLARRVWSESLFMIPPLSLCPNFPAEGITFVKLISESETIRNCIYSLIDKEADYQAKLEYKFADEMNKREDKPRKSILSRPYGMVEILRNENDSTCSLADSCLDTFHVSEIWPPNAKMAPRQRERLEYKIPTDSDLYVSRGYAYPLDLVSDPGKQVIWTAGLSTWTDLAHRNLWVHGTNDGLGESEPMRLSLLLGRKLNFIKLSHFDSDTSFNPFPLISTYRLSSPEIPSDFDPQKIKAAYWRSGSEFERVTKRFPVLKEVIHFASPGSTYTKIQKELGHKPNFRLHITLSFEDWRKQNILFD